MFGPKSLSSINSLNPEILVLEPVFHINFQTYYFSMFQYAKLWKLKLF